MENITEKVTIQGVKEINIAKEMRSSFLDYSMSVIVSRALPDVRDGLKPVHRRVVYAMNDLKLHADKSYRKSATVVGEVLGKYHPHGDSSVYDTMVRMAQDFSYRYPLVDGHGNFGSIDGDEAAAMRYTEAKMSKIAMMLVENIDEETVRFVDNYDGKEQEPSVLPSRFPNLIVNGGTGIAVGMATNLAPHNLKETINAILAVSYDRDLGIETIMEDYLFGPDFPTGAYILGRSGIRKAYETGRGSIVIRSKCEIEEMKNGKKQIIVTEIPYQVNKARMIEKIAELVRDKKIQGITDLRDESNRNGIRVVIELRRDVNAEVILNQLYKMTALQSSFGINALALVDGQPKTLNIKQQIDLYLDYQITIIKNRTIYRLRKAKDRAHILEGLKIALDNIDEVIRIIRSSKNDALASEQLINQFNLTAIQCRAILDMRLGRLTGLAYEKLEAELAELNRQILELEAILADDEKVLQIIRDELTVIRDKYGDDRRSEIINVSYDLEDEDLIPVENVVISLTSNGYIKRLPLDSYKSQNRGGKGVKGMTTNEDDNIAHILTMSSHDYLLFFTNFGRVYRLKGYNVREYSRQHKGLPIVNLLNLDNNEEVSAMIALSGHDESSKLVFATKNGIVKRVSVKEFANIRQNGKQAISLRDDDYLVGVKVTSGADEIYLAGVNGKLIRFDEENIRESGRMAKGVQGFSGEGGLCSIACSSEGEYIFVITENGYGKMSHHEEYRKSLRGGKGVKTLNMTEKNGSLINMKAVKGDEDVIIMTENGTLIRISLNQVSTLGRNTQGVRLIKVDDDSVATVSIVESDGSVDEVETQVEETVETVESTPETEAKS